MNVRAIRQSLKLTVSEFSQKTRIEQSDIRAYEMGTKEVTKEHAEKITALVILMEEV